MLDLPLADQVPDRPGHVLDRDVGIDAMLVVEVDGFDAEPLQRTFGDLSNVVGPTTDDLLAVSTAHLESKLGGDHHLIAKGLQRLADHLLVGRAVDLRGVEEGDPAFDSRTYQGDPGGLVDGRTVAVAEAHAAQAQRRDLQARSKRAPFHIELLIPTSAEPPARS